MEVNSTWEALMQMAEAEGLFYWSELMAVIFGIVYVVLAAKENVWCWFWGILSSICWTYAVFFIFNLQLEAWLQVFYVIMGFIGLYQWKFGSKEKENLQIATLSFNTHLIIVLIGSILTFLFGYLFANYTSSAATYMDAFTSIFSIITTFMIVRKILENWIYWIVIDLVSAYMYSTREGYLFAVLFIIYTIIAIQGFINWRNIYLKNQV